MAGETFKAATGLTMQESDAGIQFFLSALLVLVLIVVVTGCFTAWRNKKMETGALKAHTVRALGFCVAAFVLLGLSK